MGGTGGGAPAVPGTVTWATALPGKAHGQRVRLARRGSGVAVAYTVTVNGTAMAVATISEAGVVETAEYAAKSGTIVEANGIASLPGDGFVVVGAHNAPVSFSSSVQADYSNVDYDTLLVRFSDAKTPIWADGWGINGFKVAYAATSYGDSVWVGGKVNGDVGFGPSGGPRGWLARLSPAGTSLVAKVKTQASDGTTTYCSALEALPDGVIYVATIREASDTVDRGLRVTRTNLSGSQIWGQDFVATGSLAFSPNSAAVDATGTLWVAGFASGAGSILGQALNPAGVDGFLVRMSSTAPQVLSGEKVRLLGGDGDDRVDAVVRSADGVLVTGAFQGTANVGGLPLTSQGSTDGFVVALGADGKAAWAQRYGASGADDVTSAVDGPDAIWIAGHFEGTLPLGPTTLTSVAGGRSAFVARIAK